MTTKENQAEETRRVVRLAQWAARELPERAADVSFLETWDKPLSRSNVRYDGQSFSYRDKRLTFEIDRQGVRMGALLQEPKARSKYREFATIASLSVLATLAVPCLGYVFEESLQAEEKRLHLLSCQHLQKTKMELDVLYYRDGEISPKVYAKEKDALTKAWAQHVRLWPDYCPYAKENVRE